MTDRSGIRALEEHLRLVAENFDDLAREQRAGSWGEWARLLRDAATEIERLRLRETAIYEWAKNADPHDVGIGVLEEYLEGKRDSLG